MEKDMKALERFTEVPFSLLKPYFEPHRRYHGIHHIYHLFKELESVLWDLNKPNVVKWAVVFHDIVYDPKSQFNEANSVIVAQNFLRTIGEHPKAIRDVHNYIMATSHRKQGLAIGRPRHTRRV
jgi:predicted metal-dependent HD superfamily phosphohydrolase